ncbi:MAG: hypothetical protein EOP04_26565 [Proteobacteria bacterium]|nr:MAG: hypothetical protein EOP04_26565 [Pseudomonadota bacterium]
MPRTEGPLQTKTIWAGGELHAQFWEMQKSGNSNGYKSYTGLVQAIFAYGGQNGPIVKIVHDVTLYAKSVKTPQLQTLP